MSEMWLPPTRHFPNLKVAAQIHQGVQRSCFLPDAGLTQLNKPTTLKTLLPKVRP